ncbi:hypothetical protein MN116_001205 [Schistosoma mekongi]|uniref:K Homology domain-containing protein n=1 Tax=Schistosoma mekongi TaxID=38744 RepID=A0AAE1ZL45_SCHME|nr:hypothetical protein MN116_001205 [Schistosoma mekongi]
MKIGELRPEQSATVEALVRELQNLDSNSFPALYSLAENELFRLRGGIADSFDLVSNKPVKVRAKIEIPQAQYPTINFVGKLLGPGGQTLRAVQETTKTKMAILGAGSLRDEAKEKQLLSNGDPKYQHLKQKLHLQVDSLGPPSESCYRLAHALAEVRKIMLPEQTEPTAQQWVQQSQALPATARNVPVRNMRPALRGPPPLQASFTAPQLQLPFRGRSKPWVGRGVAKNGVSVQPPVPVASEVFTNDVNPVTYPPIPLYEQTDFSSHIFEDFGINYGQDDTWGKVSIPEPRGRGRGHPYARPGINNDHNNFG